MPNGPVLYYNGKVLTQDKNLPFASAFVVQNGCYTAVRADEVSAGELASYTNAIDLQQKLIIPAFYDAHIHIWKVGHLRTTMLDLRGVGSIREMLEKLRDFASRYPQSPWLMARGFNETLLEEQRFPTRFDLDLAVSDRPVCVIRTCAHQAIVNSAALAIAGVTTTTTTPEGGEIIRLPDGTLAGHFTETAMGLITRHIPLYSVSDYRTMVLSAQEALLEAGITAACDPAVMPDLLNVYRQMDQNGELKIRINAIPIRVPDGATETLPLPERYESDNLKIDTVKFFADGGLSGKTAAMKKPYKNTADTGVLRIPEPLFEKWASEAHRAGWRIATHAIGDRAMEMVTKVYDRLGKNNPYGLRHRIEHVGFPSRQDLQRMRDQGVFAVMQPIFIRELGRNFKKYLTEAYLHSTYPCRTITAAGIDLAFSSDAPVVRDFNPLSGITAATDRLDEDGTAIAPDEAISIESALYAYTAGSAAACGDANLLGSVSPGKKADFNSLQVSETGMVLISL